MIGKLFCHKWFSLFVACRTLVDILSLNTGDEKCDATKKACQYGTQQTCADGLSCTYDICNELTKSCDNPTTSCHGSDDPCATGQCIESFGGCQIHLWCNLGYVDGHRWLGRSHIDE